MGTCTDIVCYCVSSSNSLILFQVWFFGTSTHRLRYISLRCASVPFSFKIAKRSWCHIVIIWQDRDNVARFFHWLGFLRIPLFILCEVWVYRHDFPCFICQENETLNLLIFSWRIVYFRSCFRDWERPIKNCDFWGLAELEGHHVCSDYLLFWLQGQDSSID